MTWMRPSARSFTACTVSRYGTLAMSMPIFFWKPANTKSNMPVMVAQFSLPGLARAVSTRSFTVLMSDEDGTTTATMVLEMRAIGARSRGS